jgi:hypothetical protein
MLLTCKLPFSIVSTLNAGPRADPEGLLPRGFPPKTVLPPFGTIENRVTSAVWAIIY